LYSRIGNLVRRASRRCRDGVIGVVFFSALAVFSIA
jgi:hypothetical protein